MANFVNYPFAFMCLQAHWISRALDDNFGRFLDQHRCFQADDRLGLVPVDGAQGIRLAFLHGGVLRQALAQPGFLVIAGMSIVPTSAVPPMPFLLALRLPADVLPVSGPGGRRKPDMANPAGAGPGHETASGAQFKTGRAEAMLQESLMATGIPLDEDPGGRPAEIPAGTSGGSVLASRRRVVHIW